MLYINLLLYTLQSENTPNLDQNQISSVLIDNIKKSLSSQSPIDSCHLDELIDYLECLKQTSVDISKKVEQKEYFDFTNDSPNSLVTSSPLNKYPTRRSLNKQFESSLEAAYVDSMMDFTNGSVEKLKQMYNQCKLENLELHEKCEKIEKDWESRYNQLCEVADKALDEAKRLKDECTGLENAMDELRNEYFECEEYWSLKLDEERKLNDLVSTITPLCV